MPNVVDHLKSLRQRIAGRNDADLPASCFEHLAITRIGDQFCLDFYGDAFEENYLDLINTLARTDIAPHIRSLVLRGPDEGANGTHHWDLEPLVATDATFFSLEQFAVQLSQPADHNRSIIGAGYEEDGVLARLLAKSPNLRELTVPSAPNAAFFEVGQRPIRILSVDAGYDTQDFITNLAASSCFPDLSYLEWGEYNETYLDDFQAGCTPIEHYRTLFQSNAFGRVTFVLWRNPACSDEQILELKKLKPGLQLLVIRWSAHYVR